MTASDVETLSLRALNRATLARQMLLGREKSTPVKAVERLVGLQAQLARPPFVGLWSRIRDFVRADLARAVEKRVIVRATLLRGTLHLVSAEDYRRFRPCLQPMLDKGLASILRDRLKAIDVQALVAESRAYFGTEARTFDELRDHLAAWRPKADVRALAYIARCTVPLVQIPVAGADWTWPAAADFALADAWFGAPAPGPNGVADGAAARMELVRRYLAAFGPATPADAQTWSGFPSLRETFDALRPKLRVFRDERGRELFDLPSSPRPGEDAAAPVRFLPDFDNLVLGHADRRRVVADEHRKVISTANLQILPTFLVDGFVAGTWKAARKKTLASLEISSFERLPKPARAGLEEEGTALLRFLEPEAEKQEIRFT